MPRKAKGEGEPPPVSPHLYTREYFTTDCDGYDLFLKGESRLPERIETALELAGDLEGKWILDIGCGRGELACEAARRGAHAVGIDYAEAAIELSRERMDSLDAETRRRVEFKLADAKGLDFPDGSFDLVFLVDVYEHLHPHEIEHVLGEVKRVLRPGGALIIHTGPNTWFYRFGYPLVRTAARLLLRRELPEDLRGQYDDIMHVNEQSPLSLHRGLQRAGYRPSVLPRSFLPGINPNPLERAVMRLLFARPAGYLFCTSLMATARPREGGREARLRTERLARLLSPPRGGKVLLVGEEEGLLASRLAGLADTEVTWAETGGGGEGLGTLPPPSPGVERTAAEAHRLPFADSAFHGLAAQFTLERTADPDAALREWNRVLVPGGRMALVVRNGLFRGGEPRPLPRAVRVFTPEELARAARRAGFDVEHLSTLLPRVGLPALFRGDLDWSLHLEKLPWVGSRGRLLFLGGRKRG